MGLLFSIIKSRVSLHLRAQEVIANSVQIARRCVSKHTSAKNKINEFFVKHDRFYCPRWTEVRPQVHLRGKSICICFCQT